MNTGLSEVCDRQDRKALLGALRQLGEQAGPKANRAAISTY